jgi:hypothetical protein
MWRFWNLFNIDVHLRWFRLLLELWGVFVRLRRLENALSGMVSSPGCPTFRRIGNRWNSLHYNCFTAQAWLPIDLKGERFTFSRFLHFRLLHMICMIAVIL